MCKPHKQNHAPRKMVEEVKPRNRRERERQDNQMKDYFSLYHPYKDPDEAGRIEDNND